MSAGSTVGLRAPSADSGGVRVGRCDVDGEKPLWDLLLPLLVPRRALLEGPSPRSPAPAGTRPAAQTDNDIQGRVQHDGLYARYVGGDVLACAMLQC